MDKHEKQYRFTPYDDSEDDANDTNSNSQTTSVHLPTKDLDHKKMPVTTSEQMNGRTNSHEEEQECCNCEIIYRESLMHSTPKGILCEQCYTYWKNSGLMRPELQSSSSSANKQALKKIKRPPKNMIIDSTSLLAMANYYVNESQDDSNANIIDPIEKLEQEIRREKCTIQSHNQFIGLMSNCIRDGTESIRVPPRAAQSTLASSEPTIWLTEEILLAIQAFAKYGKDFRSVANIVQTKSVQETESFFLENRERYQLDVVVELRLKLQHQQQQQKKSSSSTATMNTDISASPMILQSNMNGATTATRV